MKITYLKHSGFLAETKQASLLFDYYAGSLLGIRTDRPLLVFVSHSHHDHYNPKIFSFESEHEGASHNAKRYVRFVLSSDVPWKWAQKKLGPAGAGLETEIVTVKERKEYTLTLPPNVSDGAPSFELLPNAERFTMGSSDLPPNDCEGAPSLAVTIRTLHSTDQGVAFLVTLGGRTFYHAGDLNLWMWKEESDEYNQKMKRDYLRELETLSGTHIDVAFVPLDPRQEEYAFEGLRLFLEKTDCPCVFPMHLWEHYEWIPAFLKEYPQYEGRVRIIRKPGETFDLP